jgi:hypothetical protein
VRTALLLVRSAALRGELRARRVARIGRVVLRCLRGACWGVPMATLAVVAFLLYAAPRGLMHPFGESKVDATTTAIKRYAFVGYPMWSAAHPLRECPASLRDLDEYVTRTTKQDAWGSPLELRCGRDLPHPMKGVWIRSAGPDREFDTADDITSAR